MAADQKDFEEYGISLDDFHINVVELLRKPIGKIDGFEKEFNDLKKYADTEKKNEYREPKAARKNRYFDILPGTTSRVILETCGDDDCSDYINANIHKSRLSGANYSYISTQAPMTTTFGDFWRMVYEQNSGLILMLTKFVEKGKSKADRYWSEIENDSKTYGFMSVTLTSMEVKESVIIRRFRILREGIAEEKEVVHLQYTGWPDMEVPKEMGNYASFFQTYRELRSFIQDTQPIIVHCSAGVGRSGTFIALDMMLDHIKHELVEGNSSFMLNVPELVQFLRSERPGMIQSKEQYRFLYDFLDHSIQNKMFDINK